MLEPRRLLAAAPAPLGDEFLLTTATQGDQTSAAVALGGDYYVAAWQGPDGGGRDIYARRFGRSGGPVGDEFPVNGSTSLDQFRPAVAASPAGFVVAWESDGQDGDLNGIYARLFDAAGNPRGDEFQVNSRGEGRQVVPAVAMAADGRFVVAWTQVDFVGLWDTVARAYDANGRPLGPEVNVLTDTLYIESGAGVGIADDGSFVVCWQGAGADSVSLDVSARRFDPGGAPRGEAFVVTTEQGEVFLDPAVAVEPDGDFVVAWHTPGPPGDPEGSGDGSGYGVFARRYAADGAARSEPFPLNSHTDGDQASPSLAAAADGGFVAAWHGSGPGGGQAADVYVRRFGPGGAATAPEVALNAHAAGDQTFASVALAPDGQGLAVWRSAGQDGSGLGVYGRYLAADAPPADPPAVSVADAAVAEGGAGAAAQAVFTVTLSGARDYPVTVRYATLDGSAAAPGDYAAASGTLTFAPGETSKAVAVTIADDALDEADETFSLVLSDTLNATLADSSAAATVNDDDPLPVMTIADASAAEGVAGGVVFTVTLSRPSGRPVHAAYVLGRGAADTATPDGDYDATGGFIEFDPGQTVAEVVVPLSGDALDEADETFTVLLGYAGTPTFELAGDGGAVGTIVDDDAAPSAAAGRVTVVEGDDPAGRLVDVPITLSAPSGLPVTVEYATADDTAAAPGDYAAAAGAVTFAPGETVRVVQVRVVGDGVQEAPAEAFYVRLFGAPGAAPSDGRVTVEDDDAPPPAVAGVFVSGTRWTPGFRQRLAAAGAGSEQFGYLVPGGAGQSDVLPWAHVDRVSVRFDRDVVPDAPAVSVVGVRGGDYAVALAEYDGQRFTYTFTLARPITNDRVTLRIGGGTSGPGVRDARSGMPLDGEWADGQDQYPSGDGTAGGDFAFGFNVLGGDVTRDGAVTGADLFAVRSFLTTSAAGRTSGRYSILHDVDGSGRVDLLDYVTVRARQRSALPPQPVAATGSGEATSLVRVAPGRRQVFGSAPVLA